MVFSTMASSDFSPGFPLDFTSSAYTSGYDGWSTDRMRPPLFRRLLCAMQCIASIPLPYAGGSFAAASRFFTASVAFAFADKLGSL